MTRTCVHRSAAEKARILRVVVKHPELSLAEIGKQFGMSDHSIEWLVFIERRKGQVIDRDVAHKTRRLPKKRRKQSDLQYEWELRLSKLGLGMDRGWNPSKVEYGFNFWDERESATQGEE